MTSTSSSLNLSSNQSAIETNVKWDIPEERAQRLYKELGVNPLPPPTPSTTSDDNSPPSTSIIDSPITPKVGRDDKENRAESGYFSSANRSIQPVFAGKFR